MPYAYKLKNKNILYKIFALRAQGYSLRQIAEVLKNEDGVEVSQQAVKYVLDKNPLIRPDMLPPDSVSEVVSKLDEIVSQIDKLNKEAWSMYEILKEHSKTSPRAAVKAVYILDKILKQVELASKLKDNIASETQSHVSYIELSTKLVKVLNYLETKGIIKILKKRALNDLQGSDVS